MSGTLTKGTSDNVCPQCNHTQTLAPEEVIFCVKCRFPMAILLGKYRCVKELGEGGFGTVYLAEELQAGPHKALCVLKVLKPETVSIKGMVKRFQREIRLTQQLSEHNEHIVKLLDFGEEQGIGHFYVMEHLEGKELFTRLRGKTPLTYKEIFHIFRQLCEGIAIAHQKGVIHRDLKPNNIFLVSKGDDPLFVKIIDFGIAKPLEGTANPDLTKGMLGTPHYMPPEQCANQAIDQRSDIYAMGAILFEMLTGRPPFSGELTDILLQKMTREPPRIREMQPDRDFPEELDQTIAKAMAKEPNERFRTAAAFWKSLAPHVGSFEEELMLDGRTIDWDELDDDSLLIADTGAFNEATMGIHTGEEAEADTISSSQDALEMARTAAHGMDDAFAMGLAPTMNTPLPHTPLPPEPDHPTPEEANIILSNSIAQEALSPNTPPNKQTAPVVYLAIGVAILLVIGVVALLMRS